MSENPFPPVEHANADGLLAMGGELDTSLLLMAYRHGVFPWNNPGQPILWWAPDPRTVLYLDEFKISRSLRKTLKRDVFTVTMDSAFEAVIAACAKPEVRRYTDGTWITPAMHQAYTDLHRAGFAHSVECWHDNELCGGLYGVSLGKMFFGESMFSYQADASKVATAWLVRQLKSWQFELIDCQLPSDHLFSLGAREISRPQFMMMLEKTLDSTDKRGYWTLETTHLDEW